MQHYNFNPFPEMRTERLLLRSLTMEDAPALFYLKSNKEILKYLDRAPQKNITESEIFLKDLFEQQAANTAVLWAIALKEKPAEMIGNIGYWRLIKEHHRAEIGYSLNNSFWKMGIMDEALKAVIAYGLKKMKLHSIEANINPDNLSSQLLLERNEFLREGYFKENYYYDGAFTDSAIYSLLNKK
ncbi:MAG: GNAT family N-acetyltransferase [Ferruginibacter sp.]